MTTVKKGKAMTEQELAGSVICKGDTLQIISPNRRAGKNIVVDAYVGNHFLYTNEDGSTNSIREDLAVRVSRGPNLANCGSGYYAPKG